GRRPALDALRQGRRQLRLFGRPPAGLRPGQGRPRGPRGGDLAGRRGAALGGPGGGILLAADGRAGEGAGPVPPPGRPVTRGASRERERPEETSCPDPPASAWSASASPAPPPPTCWPAPVTRWTCTSAPRG